MTKIKQRITDLRCEITAITTQRESLDAMQQLELFGLKERLRELEAFVNADENHIIPKNVFDNEANKLKSFADFNTLCKGCGTITYQKLHAFHDNHIELKCLECGEINRKLKE